MKKPIDFTLLFIVLWMLVFGFMMISSVSVYPSYKVTNYLVSKGIIAEAYNYFYFLRTFKYTGIGLIILVFFIKFPYHFLEKYANQILGFSLLLLVSVLVIGVELNGAKWWINIPWISFSLQPVEFAKVGLIVFMAAYLKKFRYKIQEFQSWFLKFCLYPGIVLCLLALQPDFGSILIIAPVIIALYFVGGGNMKYIVISIFIATLGASAIYWLGKIWDSKLSYISGRIDNFLRSSHEIIEKSNPDGKDYQIKQGLIAIGSGGFGGLGFGNSIQKFWYLPEVQGDFIFSVIVEELGFMWGFILVCCYLILVFRIFMIARNTKDIFAKNLAFGIGSLLIVQTFINLGVNLNIIPLTGVTLPLISYGGSSLISFMIAFGIVLNISRTVEKTDVSLYETFSSKRKVMRT